MIADSPPASERRPRRRWWLAFLLSLFAPGLGHLYAGSLSQALLAVSACAIFGAISVWLFIQPLGAYVNWGGVLLAVLTLLAIAIHAARIAPSGRPLGISRPLRICVYVLYVVVISVASDLAKSWLRTDLYTAFSVTTAAMFPTLHVGDDFVVDKRAYARPSATRGCCRLPVRATRWSDLRQAHNRRSRRPNQPQSWFDLPERKPDRGHPRRHLERVGPSPSGLLNHSERTPLELPTIPSSRYLSICLRPWCRRSNISSWATIEIIRAIVDIGAL